MRGQCPPVPTNHTDNAEDGTAHTTAPAIASPAHDAEFCDSHGAKARFGLGRSYLYTLEAEGKIRGVSLRKKGQLRGKRLWDVASIRRFLTSPRDAAPAEGGGK
jgi:hypothetical protein